jgi:hypothetical protein
MEKLLLTRLIPIDILYLVGTYITRLHPIVLFWLARLKTRYGETFVNAINYD